MSKKFRLLVLLGVLAMTGAMAGTAIAATYDSPATVTSTGDNTINWTGQGTINESLDTTQCDQSNTPYLLWIFTTDHATLGSPDPVLHLGGSGSGDYIGTQFGNEWHFQTPFYDLSSLTSNVTFNVGSLPTDGSSQMNLVISHGCPGSNGPPPAKPLAIDKTASENSNTEYSWTINKLVDKKEIDLTPPTSSATFNYTVTVTHDSGTTTHGDVAGKITVSNPNSGDVSIDSVTDQLSSGDSCIVDTSGGLSIPADGSTVFPYTCALNGNLPSDAPNTTNTANISWSDQTLSDGSFLAADSASVTVPVDFTTSVSDNCVDVSDSYAGDLSGATQGNPYPTCVAGTGDANGTFTFTYSRRVLAPTLGTCQTYDNTASFADNSTPQNTGNASQSVKTCNYNAPLTIGYWGNHLAPNGTSGCTGLPSGTGCSSNGPWTKQFLAQSLGNYSVSTFQLAAKVFAANNCSNASSSNQNAVGCLAAQLLGAELNVANLSNPCIVTVKDGINDANSFMSGQTVDGVGGFSYSGPTGKYTLTTAQRNEALTLKNELVNYNQGGGC